MSINETTVKGPRWIKQWIADLALLNEQFRNDDGSVDFEALGREEYMFRTALITQKLDKSERARVTFMKAKAAYDASSENGKKGGRPRKETIQGDAGHREAPDESTTVSDISGTPEALVNQPRGEADSLRGECHSAPPRTLPLPTWDEFTLFIDGDGLDYTDAREWWEMTMVDRAGHDRYGRTITNWKVACRRFCKAKANKRTPNGETT